MKIRPVSAAFLIAALALLFSGCPEPGSRITFWLMPNAPPESHTAWLDEKKREFLKETGVEVNYEILSWGESWKRIEAGLFSDAGPDVIQIRSTWSAAFAKRGGFRDLSPGEFGGKDSFLENLLPSAEFQETFFAVPWFAETTALFCNNRLFGDAGVKPPVTIAELFAVGKRIVRKNGQGTGLSLPGVGSPDLINYWSPFFYSYGGRFLSEDQRSALFGGEEGVRAAQAYLLFFSEGIAPATAALSSTAESRDLFSRGKTAMCFLTPTDAGTLAEQNPALSFSAVPLPAGPDGRHASLVGSNLVIPKGSVNPQKAARWINFLLRDENLLSYAHDLVRMLPAKKKVLENAAFSTGEWPVYRETIMTALPYPGTASWLTIEGETSAALKLMLIAFVNGKYTPELVRSALHNAEDTVNEALQR